MTDEAEDHPFYYTDEDWWIIPLKERDEDDLAILCNLVEVKDSESDLADYFHDDYEGETPEWLSKRIDRYEANDLLSMGEGSHGMYFGLHSLWDKEAHLGILLFANIDEKFPMLNSFYNNQNEGMDAAIRQGLREAFDYNEPNKSGKTAFDDICIFDPKYINSGIDEELKKLVRHLYKITEGGLMREQWPTADDWIKEALPS